MYSLNLQKNFKTIIWRTGQVTGQVGGEATGEVTGEVRRVVSDNNIHNSQFTTHHLDSEG